ncbi:hypothetical protein M427DRAFT_65676 [Gonapodya prolifera JEL478]|uniref:Uncharacterized protein n=1 Tax=Gonapodya prolifera (strain JEL478) TaxID=1344416 RepID=A0A139AYC6_GONPJ|nr:hypothetical protein M427DRAFT_65676 [Gonapodya prolifera JEL478]|eukprot:KXS21704.1 hypothetical protein M427DRAFT_65676 [Gonapodya prolifera JEL478]
MSEHHIGRKAVRTVEQESDGGVLSSPESVASPGWNALPTPAALSPIFAYHSLAAHPSISASPRESHPTLALHSPIPHHSTTCLPPRSSSPLLPSDSSTLFPASISEISLDHFRNTQLEGFARASIPNLMSNNKPPLPDNFPLNPYASAAPPSVLHRAVFHPELAPDHLATFLPAASPVLDLGSAPDTILGAAERVAAQSIPIQKVSVSVDTALDRRPSIMTGSPAGPNDVVDSAVDVASTPTKDGSSPSQEIGNTPNLPTTPPVKDFSGSNDTMHDAQPNGIHTPTNGVLTPPDQSSPSRSIAYSDDFNSLSPSPRAKESPSTPVLTHLAKPIVWSARTNGAALLDKEELRSEPCENGAAGHEFRGWNSVPRVRAMGNGVIHVHGHGGDFENDYTSRVMPSFPPPPSHPVPIPSPPHHPALPLQPATTVKSGHTTPSVTPPGTPSGPPSPANSSRPTPVRPIANPRGPWRRHATDGAIDSGGAASRAWRDGPRDGWVAEDIVDADGDEGSSESGSPEAMDIDAVGDDGGASRESGYTSLGAGWQEMEEMGPGSRSRWTGLGIDGVEVEQDEEYGGEGNISRAFASVTDIRRPPRGDWGSGRVGRYGDMGGGSSGEEEGRSSFGQGYRGGRPGGSTVWNGWRSQRSPPLVAGSGGGDVERVLTRKKDGTNMDAAELQRLLREHGAEERKKREVDELKEKIMKAVVARGVIGTGTKEDQAKASKFEEALERKRRREEKKKEREGVIVSGGTAQAGTSAVPGRQTGPVEPTPTTKGDEATVTLPEKESHVSGEVKGKKAKGRKKGKKGKKKAKKTGGGAGGVAGKEPYGEDDGDDDEEADEEVKEEEGKVLGGAESSLTLVDGDDAKGTENGNVYAVEDKAHKRDGLVAEEQVEVPDRPSQEKPVQSLPGPSCAEDVSEEEAAGDVGEVAATGPVPVIDRAGGAKSSAPPHAPTPPPTIGVPQAGSSPASSATGGGSGGSGAGRWDDAVEFLAVSPLVPSWAYAGLIDALGAVGWRTASTARTIVDSDRHAYWELPPAFRTKFPDERGWSRSAALLLELHRIPRSAPYSDFPSSQAVLSQITSTLPLGAIPANVPLNHLFGRVNCSTNRYEEDQRYKVVDIMGKVPTRMSAEGKIADRPSALWKGEGVPQMVVVACRTVHGLALLRRLVRPPPPTPAASNLYQDPPTRFELLGLKCADSLRLNQAKVVTPFPVGHPGYSKSLSMLMARLVLDEERSGRMGFAPFVQWVIISLRGFSGPVGAQEVVNAYRAEKGLTSHSVEIVASPTAEAGYDWSATFFRDTELVQDAAMFAKTNVWLPEKMHFVHPMRWAVNGPMYESTVCIIREPHVPMLGKILAELNKGGLVLAGMGLATLGLTEAARLVAAEAEREPALSSKARQSFQAWHSEKQSLVLCLLGTNVVKEVQLVLQMLNQELLSPTLGSAREKRPVSARERLLEGVFSPTSLSAATRCREALFPTGPALVLKSRVVDRGFVQILEPGTIPENDSLSHPNSFTLPPNVAASYVVLPSTSSSYSNSVGSWSAFLSLLLHVEPKSSAVGANQLHLLGVWIGSPTQKQREHFLNRPEDQSSSRKVLVDTALKRGPCLAIAIGSRGRYMPLSERLRDVLLRWDTPVAVPHVARTQQAALDHMAAIFNALTIPAPLCV